MTGEQLPVVYLSQHTSQQLNHTPSAKAMAHGYSKASTTVVSIGDLIFLKGDKDKLKVRDKYLVIGINEAHQITVLQQSLHCAYVRMLPSASH